MYPHAIMTFPDGEMGKLIEMSSKVIVDKHGPWGLGPIC